MYASVDLPRSPKNEVGMGGKNLKTTLSVNIPKHVTHELKKPLIE